MKLKHLMQTCDIVAREEAMICHWHIKRFLSLKFREKIYFEGTYYKILYQVSQPIYSIGSRMHLRKALIIDIIRHFLWWQIRELALIL